MSTALRRMTCQSRSWRVGRVSAPIVSLDELAQPDLWESEQEYKDFLADLYASRRSEVA